MFAIERFDLIIVPLATDSIVLNIEYKTDKFISFSEIFYHDTFIYILKMRFNSTEEKILRKLCSGKKIGFVQLPNIYSDLAQFLADLKCEIIFLANKPYCIVSQLICEDLLEEAKKLEEYIGEFSTYIDEKIYYDQKTIKNNANEVFFILESSKDDGDEIEEKDKKILNIAEQANENIFDEIKTQDKINASDKQTMMPMLGADHIMINMLMPSRRLISVLWNTEFGQNLYRMAKYIYYYDEHIKDAALLDGVPVKNIEVLTGLRYYANVLSAEAMFTEQLKQLNCNMDLLGSFVRFVTLHYQHMHVHYLTLLTAFLKNKYCMHANIVNPIYPIHSLRFFDKPFVLAGFLEQDEYYDFTLQTIHTGNPLYLLHTTIYIEHIAHVLRLKYNKIQHAAIEMNVLQENVDQPNTKQNTDMMKQDQQTAIERLEYDIDAFLAIDQTEDTLDHIDDIYKLNNVLYKLFNMFVHKRDATLIYQELSPFECSLIKSMYQCFMKNYDDAMLQMHIAPLDIRQQFTHLHVHTSLLPYKIFLTSSHYYIQTYKDLYLIFISFGSQFILTRKLLLQIYTANMHYSDISVERHFILVNMEGSRVFAWDAIMKGCKGYLKTIFG